MEIGHKIDRPVPTLYYVGNKVPSKGEYFEYSGSYTPVKANGLYYQKYDCFSTEEPQKFTLIDHTKGNKLFKFLRQSCIICAGESFLCGGEIKTVKTETCMSIPVAIFEEIK